MSKEKVTLSPDQITAKWQQNLKGSVPYIQAGIDSVSESPMEKAAAQQDKMLAGVQAAVQSGKWANALRAVDLASWKAITKQKIQTTLAAGVDAAVPKHRKFSSYLVNTVNSGLQAIKGMPSGTFQDNINRMVAMVSHMHDNPYK